MSLVGRQNRKLLTMLRVFCSRPLRDWDQQLDKVMGAYNSTRHATTGFLPYMLTKGTEKAIASRFYILSPPHSLWSHMKRMWIKYWLAIKRFMTWYAVPRTKPSSVRS